MVTKIEDQIKDTQDLKEDKDKEILVVLEVIRIKTILEDLLDKAIKARDLPKIKVVSKAINRPLPLPPPKFKATMDRLLHKPKATLLRLHPRGRPKDTPRPLILRRPKGTTVQPPLRPKAMPEPPIRHPKGTLEQPNHHPKVILGQLKRRATLLQLKLVPNRATPTPLLPSLSLMDILDQHQPKPKPILERLVLFKDKLIQWRLQVRVILQQDFKLQVVLPRVMYQRKPCRSRYPQLRSHRNFRLSLRLPKRGQLPPLEPQIMEQL